MNHPNPNNTVHTGYHPTSIAVNDVATSVINGIENIPAVHLKLSSQYVPSMNGNNVAACNKNAPLTNPHNI
jgi:hypothetical protein